MSALRWCRFSGTDPYENLAREEALFNSFPESDIVLLLYVNDSSIIIGKHQNPWREIDVPLANELRIPIIRRLSGGGTVYHDSGNLVFSFMRDRDSLDRIQNLRIVCETLVSMNLPCEIKGTYDLYARDRKISGNAFCFQKNRGIHHGTLLVDADLTRLYGILRRNEATIRTHAVESRPAVTANLRHLEPLFDVTEFEQRVVRRAASEFGVSEVERFHEDDIDTNNIESLIERNRSWEWTFGKTPAFSVDIPANNQHGITLEVKHGVIENVTGTLPGFSADLVGIRFDRAAISQAVTKGATDILFRESGII